MRVDNDASRAEIIAFVTTEVGFPVELIQGAPPQGMGDQWHWQMRSKFVLTPFADWWGDQEQDWYPSPLLAMDAFLSKVERFKEIEARRLKEAASSDTDW